MDPLVIKDAPLGFSYCLEELGDIETAMHSTRAHVHSPQQIIAAPLHFDETAAVDAAYGFLGALPEADGCLTGLVRCHLLYARTARPDRCRRPTNKESIRA